MKVLLLSTSDIGHGAGVSAFRLHHSLKEAGIESNMLVCEKLSDDPNVHRLRGIPGNKVSKIIMKVFHVCENLINLLGPQNVFSVMALGIQNHELVKSADVIHLHNIHWSSRNLSLLLLFLKKPVFWTLHDQWPVTGHCFYSSGCERWMSGCGKCPDLKIFPRILYDNTSLQWRLKRYIYKKTRPRIISPSSWLENITRRSPLFENCEKYRIPYGVNQADFRPADKTNARTTLGLDINSKYILWAASDINDPRKGFGIFANAMKLWKQNYPDVVILIAGKGPVDRSIYSDNYQVKYLGHIASSSELSRVLSASDIFVSTSLQDNLPNIILESLGAGLPVIAFDVGGIGDMVKHDKNGYLVNINDCEGLANRIYTLIGDERKLLEMSNAAVDTVNEEFTYSLQAERHIKLYQNALTPE